MSGPRVTGPRVKPHRVYCAPCGDVVEIRATTRWLAIAKLDDPDAHRHRPRLAMPPPEVRVTEGVPVARAELNLT